MEKKEIRFRFEHRVGVRFPATLATCAIGCRHNAKHCINQLIVINLKKCFVAIIYIETWTFGKALLRLIYYPDLILPISLKIRSP